MTLALPDRLLAEPDTGRRATTTRASTRTDLLQGAHAALSRKFRFCSCVTRSPAGEEKLGKTQRGVSAARTMKTIQQELGEGSTTRKTGGSPEEKLQDADLPNALQRNRPGTGSIGEDAQPSPEHQVIRVIWNSCWSCQGTSLQRKVWTLRTCGPVLNGITMASGKSKNGLWSIWRC